MQLRPLSRRKQIFARIPRRSSHDSPPMPPPFRRSLSLPFSRADSLSSIMASANTSHFRTPISVYIMASGRGRKGLRVPYTANGHLDRYLHLISSSLLLPSVCQRAEGFSFQFHIRCVYNRGMAPSSRLPDLYLNKVECFPSFHIFCPCTHHNNRWHLAAVLFSLYLPHHHHRSPRHT